MKNRIWCLGLGYYNKRPSTGYFINNKHLFLTVLEAGKSKIMAPEDSVSGESPSPRQLSFYCNLTRCKGQVNCLEVSFMRRDLPKAPPPNIIILGIRS